MSKAKKEKKRTTTSLYREVIMVTQESTGNTIGPPTILCMDTSCVWIEIGSKRVYIDASCEDVYVSVEGTIGEAFIGSDSGEGEEK